MHGPLRENGLPQPSKTPPAQAIDVHPDDLPENPTFYAPDFNKIKRLLKQAIRLAATSERVCKCKYLPSSLTAIRDFTADYGKLTSTIEKACKQLFKRNAQAYLRFTDNIKEDQDEPQDDKQLTIEQAS